MLSPDNHDDFSLLSPEYLALGPRVAKTHGTMVRAIDKAYETNSCSPCRREDVFRWSYATPVDRVKWAYVGQSPYPQPGFADGVAFSTRYHKRVEALSLANLYRGLYASTRIMRTRTDLDDVCARGVLFVNFHPIVRLYGNDDYMGVMPVYFWKAVFDCLKSKVGTLEKIVLFGREACKLEDHLVDKCVCERVVCTKHVVKGFDADFPSDVYDDIPWS